MKRAQVSPESWLLLLFVALAWAVLPAAASGPKFNTVVAGLQRQFSIRGRRVPMLWFASCVTRMFTWGGVKQIQVEEFNGLGANVTPEALEATLRDRLGDSWRPFITDQDRRSGDTTIIYAQGAGGSMAMMIADLQNGELTLTEVKLNGKRLAAWLNHPRDSVHHSHDAL